MAWAFKMPVFLIGLGFLVMPIELQWLDRLIAVIVFTAFGIIIGLDIARDKRKKVQ